MWLRRTLMPVLSVIDHPVALSGKIPRLNISGRPGVKPHGGIAPLPANSATTPFICKPIAAHTTIKRDYA